MTHADARSAQVTTDMIENGRCDDEEGDEDGGCGWGYTQAY